ncbi:hypothetical protein SAMN05216338_10636 [Bradyrhizobium sp. Rc2d]|nr:hypothetical protein SAMN05216338_10636 [Bradyrhizobium sp. Rc2d]
MLRQIIAEALGSGADPKSILYASIDAPVYSRMPLEKFLSFLPDAKETGIIIFDEIQYLPDWEVHLKDLVDSYPNIKFIASGSAAAALRLKSRESGAGRFSEFMLPPLTFYEFLLFSGVDEQLIEVDSRSDRPVYSAREISVLNERFIDYLNYGGYPEAVLNQEVRESAEQFIRNDIIDKVLLKDLPSLYGINDITELNRLFSVLAYNAGNEVNLESISKSSGITKPTIKRYIEYLESAFLIIKLTTVDDNCRTLQRERNFKVYLNNPSMRAALFAPVKTTETDKIGHLAESAIISQWQHAIAFRQLRYARWRNEGEVDVVYLSGADGRPDWVGEIKWSDRIADHFAEETRSILTLIQKHKSIRSAFFTTKTTSSVTELDGRPVAVTPSALYCYTVGRNVTSQLSMIAFPELATKVSAA